MVGKPKPGLERARGAMSGLLGAALPAEMRRPVEMQLHCHGRRVAPDELAEVVRARPPGSDVVFLVHGLMRDEGCWHAASFDMAAALERELGVLAVDVRYDTGWHISDNGGALAALLEALAAAVGEPRGRWHIVAHSMGGLVARSALYQAGEQGMAFTRLVDKVFLIGTPNRGARLARSAELAAAALGVAQVTLRATASGVRGALTSVRVGNVAPLRPIAAVTDVFVDTIPSFFVNAAGRALDLRSDGIRDLRHGTMLREEWEQQPGGPKPRRRPVPPPPWVRTYAIAGALSRRRRDARPARVTDGLVSAASASNAGDDELGIVANGRFCLLPGVGHMEMPRHPEVFRTLQRWLAEDAAPRPGGGATPRQSGGA
jgi:pimeloyl-ACP methyl ester carboxylesterase